MEQILKVRIVADAGGFKAIVDGASSDISALDANASRAGRSIQQNFDAASDSTKTLQTELRNTRRDISALLAIGELQKVTGDIVNFGDIVTAVFAGKVVGSLSLYVKETLASVIAYNAQRTAALQAVAATTAHHIALAQHYAATVAATGANTLYAASLRAQIVASNAATIAARGTAASMTLVSRAMSLLGGPIGLITLGATALSFWALKAREAKDETEKLTTANKSLADSYLNGTRQGIAEQIIALEDKISSIRSHATQNTPALDAVINPMKLEIANLKDQLLLLGEKERRLRAITSIGSDKVATEKTGASGRASGGQTTAQWAAEQAIALQRQLAEEGARTTESVRKDYEILQAEVARYSGLLSSGAIDQETFNRLIEQSGMKFSGASEQAKEYTKLISELDPAMAKALKYLADYDLLASQITDPARLEAARDALIALRFKGEDIKEPAQESADQVAQIYEDTASSIRSAFRDTFRSVFDDGLSGFKDFGDRMLSVFKDMLADMVTMAIARPVIVPMVAGLGSMLGVQNSAQAAVIQQLGGGTVDSSLAGMAGSAMGFGMLGTFGTGLSATLPGFLGGAGGGFAAASQLGGLGATSAGAFAGAALPWVGGALLLNSVTGGGLFGTDWKTKDEGLDLSLSGGDVTGRNFNRQKKKKALFAGSKSRTRYSAADADLLSSINDTLDASIDTLLAGAGGLGVSTAQQIIDGFTSTTRLSLKGKSDEEAQKIISDWLDKTFLSMSQAILGDTRFSGLLINANADMAKAIFGVGGYLGANPLADSAELTRRAAMSLKDQYDEQRQSLLELIGVYDGSLSATQALATATQERYQTELALLQQIASVRVSVQDVLGTSIEGIRQSTMSPSQLYSYLTGQAEGLSGQLSSATDPTTIQSLVQRIDALTNQAYGLIPTGAQAGVSQQFIDFLTGVQTSAEQSLSNAEKLVQSTHDDLSAAIKDSMAQASAQLIDAAHKQSEAAAAALEAAKQLTTAVRGYYRYQ